jgi:hypothetical protein
MLSQDGDPPPPMLAILYAIYWIPLALILHYFLTKKKTDVQ